MDGHGGDGGLQGLSNEQEYAIGRQIVLIGERRRGRKANQEVSIEQRLQGGIDLIDGRVHGPVFTLGLLVVVHIERVLAGAAEERLARDAWSIDGRQIMTGGFERLDPARAETQGNGA